MFNFTYVVFVCVHIFLADINKKEVKAWDAIRDILGVIGVVALGTEMKYISVLYS